MDRRRFAAPWSQSLFQLLSLPHGAAISFDCDEVRDKQSGHLHAVQVPQSSGVAGLSSAGRVRGQWWSRGALLGYRCEPKVSPTSNTDETYVALRLQIDMALGGVAVLFADRKALAAAHHGNRLQFPGAHRSYCSEDKIAECKPIVSLSPIQPDRGPFPSLFGAKVRARSAARPGEHGV